MSEFESYISSRPLVKKYGAKLDLNSDKTQYKDFRIQQHYITWKAAIASMHGESVGYVILTENDEMRMNFYPKAIKEGLVNIGDKLYTYPPDAAKRIAELERFVEEALNAHPNLDLDIEAIQDSKKGGV